MQGQACVGSRTGVDHAWQGFVFYICPHKHKQNNLNFACAHNRRSLVLGIYMLAVVRALLKNLNCKNLYPLSLFKHALSLLYVARHYSMIQDANEKRAGCAKVVEEKLKPKIQRLSDKNAGCLCALAA